MLTKKNFVCDFILPHLNYEGIEKCLQTLIKYTPQENIGKIILINQSGEQKEFLDKYVDIHLKINNQGFARSANLGIRLSDSDYVGILNDDVEFLNSRWIDGIIKTFNRYGEQALCINCASVCDPDGRGGKVIMDGFTYHDNWTEEEYDKLMEAGKDQTIDGICFWFPIFKRDRLEKVLGSIYGKCWLDERFFPGGGEDYDCNRRAYLTCSICGKYKEEHKNITDHEFKSYRCLGYRGSWVWHHWYKTKKADGKEGVKFDGKTFDDKWGMNADIYGKNGLQDIPINLIRNI